MCSLWAGGEGIGASVDVHCGARVTNDEGEGECVSVSVWECVCVYEGDGGKAWASDRLQTVGVAMSWEYELEMAGEPHYPRKCQKWVIYLVLSSNQFGPSSHNARTSWT